MKLLAKLSPSFLAIGLSLLLLMCKKDDAGSLIRANHPPVAHAGADITLNRVSCSSPNWVQLDASSSSDADRDKLLYKWTKISGPFCNLSSPYSQIAEVNNLQAGQYAFELNITDPKGLSSKDTLVVDVIGSPSPTEVDLDVTVDGSYSFSISDGFGSEDIYLFLCQVLHSCPVRDVKARTNLLKTFNEPTWGKFMFRIDEIADTSVSSNNHQTFMTIMSANIQIPSGSVSGRASINFKQLIQGGGGSFSGTLEMNSGSAGGCDPNVFANLALITISGILDAERHNMTLTLKGKVYF